MFTASAYGQQPDTSVVCQLEVSHGYNNDPKWSIKCPMPINENSDFNSMDVTSHSGDLATQLGDRIYVIDSLVVRGTVDDADISTLWDASFNGRLSVINLENAEIKNGVMPKCAFWHQKEQLNPDWRVTPIFLRRIILPEGLKRIEERAFFFCVNLEEVNIPSSLQYLGDDAFSDCVNLKTDPLVFPEGFERFGKMVFLRCRSLTGQVVLPSTIKEIGTGLFFSSKISSINLPDGLEKIGDAAFYACRLKEVVIPNSCQKLKGSSNFALNYTLEKISLPEGVDTIPSDFCYVCNQLKEVNIPSTVKIIGLSAFELCSSLKKIELPYGLKAIWQKAFMHCDSLEQVVLPSTLKTLSSDCFSYIRCLKRIYCMAPEPPVCMENPYMIGITPFGDPKDVNSSSTPNDIPVYVPVGSAEKYRKAWGWDYFTNFIETDDFPTAIYDVTTEHSDSRSSIYDLNGRKVTDTQKGHIYIINGKKVFLAR